VATEGKYGKVLTEKGTIGADEPVFLLRAQDAYAVETIKYYHTLCASGSTTLRHQRGIIEAMADFLRWQEDHVTKLPGSNP
jgi:hypothetical protein